MIPVSKAIEIVKRQTGKLGKEAVKLPSAVGRVLAENIIADSDMPPFDRSQMDGYAMKAKDTANAPVDLKVVGESAAGRGWHKKLKSGEAIRIMTGAAVPDGADAIQKVELTSESNDIVTIQEPTETGKYIVKKGAEIKRGEKLIDSGERIDERLIASLAAFGYSMVKVSKRPTVSILGTGSEIVSIDRKPGRDQIRNSNSVMLKALAEEAGASARILPNSSDDLQKLKSRITKAVGNDILVITGGVSVGKYDLTKAALHELGAKIYFERVRLRPGKPTVLARLGKTLIFGLPGNPVSSAVTFYLFVRPSILKMQSARGPDLADGYAVLTADARAAKERDTYFPATLGSEYTGRLLATPLRWHGSSDFVGFARADALIYLERGKAAAAGDVERILFL
jgi:molybdopterin molybdotransferase